MNDEKNITLIDLEQKIINYLYQKDLNTYTNMDYVLLQWISEKN